MHWLMSWGLLALCLTLAPASARAQVTLEARLGLQGVIRLGKWNALTVQVHNHGGPLTATLAVSTWLGSEARGDVHTATVTRHLELPPGARKRLTLAVPMRSTADPVDITLRQDTAVLAQQRLHLRETLHAEHIVLGLTRDVSLDFLATLFTNHTRVAYLPPGELPSQWSAYDSVSALVLKGFSLQTLSEEQMTALQQWLANGGTLVVAGDSQYTLLTEPRLRALLPVEVQGLQHLEGLPALAERYGSPLPDTPLAMLRARLLRGQVLVGTAAEPLLAQRRFGRGRVVFLAVDYARQPLPGWPGNAALWREILQPTEQVEYGQVLAELGLHDEAHPIMKLLGRPVLTFPSHLTLSAFLLAYGGSLGLIFWLLNRRRQQRWPCWAGIGLLILAASGVALSPWLERGLDYPALLFDATTVENVPDTDYARLLGYVGLFAIRQGTFTLPLQHSGTILRHTFTRGAGQAGKEVEISQDGAPVLRHLRLAPWALRVFSTETLTQTPLQVTTRQQEAGLTIQMHNRSPLPFQGSTVVYQGKLFALGNLAPGEASTDHLYPALYQAEQAQEMAWRVLLKRRPAVSDVRLTYQQEVLLQQYFGDKRLAETSSTPFVTGWFLAPGTLTPAPTPALRRGVTLVVSRFTL
ncbi:MAG: hypothetical protein AB7N91_02115 [Candidatus Tectimicrobiota bacterium]